MPAMKKEKKRKKRKKKKMNEKDSLCSLTKVFSSFKQERCDSRSIVELGLPPYIYSTHMHILI
jgi:hypothetical protein